MELIKIRMSGVTLPRGWELVNIHQGYREGAYQVLELKARCAIKRGDRRPVVTVPIPETGDVIVDFPVATTCAKCPNELICMIDD